MVVDELWPPWSWLRRLTPSTAARRGQRANLVALPSRANR